MAGEMKLPAATAPRTHRGALATIPIAPTEFSRDGPRAGDPAQRPGTLERLRHRPLGRRATARRHAGERRVRRVASPPESARRCWPGANDLQTPSVPGTRGPRASTTPAARTAGTDESREVSSPPTPPCGRVGGSPRELKRGRNDRRHQRSETAGLAGKVGGRAGALSAGAVVTLAFALTYIHRGRLGSKPACNG